MFIASVQWATHPSGVLCLSVNHWNKSALRSLQPAGVRLRNNLTSINIAPRWGATASQSRVCKHRTPLGASELFLKRFQKRNQRLAIRI
jgi:hypothetical protein